MAQKQRRVFLQVERMEPKQLLSSTAIGALAPIPVLTMSTCNSTLAGVEKALGTVAKTHNFSQLDASLATLAARLPYGRQQLLPLWNNDLNIYDPNIHGSGLAMQRQMLSDTVAYVQNGVTEGLFRVSGSGASGFYQGKPYNDWKRVQIYRDPPQNWPENDFAVATVTNDTGMTLSATVSASVSVSGTTKLFPPDQKKPTPFSMTQGSTTLLYLAYNGKPNAKDIPSGALFQFTLGITNPPKDQPPLLMQNIPFAGRYGYDSFNNGTAKIWEKPQTDSIQKYDLTAVRNNEGVITKYVLSRT